MARKILDRVSRKLKELSSSTFNDELMGETVGSTLSPPVNMQLKAIADKMKTMHELFTDFYDLYLIFHRNLEDHLKPSDTDNLRSTADTRLCTSLAEEQISESQPPTALATQVIIAERPTEVSMVIPVDNSKHLRLDEITPGITAVDVVPVVQQNTNDQMASSECGSPSKYFSAAEVVTSPDDVVTSAVNVSSIDVSPSNDRTPFSGETPSEKKVKDVSVATKRSSSRKRKISSDSQVFGGKLRLTGETLMTVLTDNALDGGVRGITILPMEVAVCRLEDARVNAQVPVREATEQTTPAEDEGTAILRENASESRSTLLKEAQPLTELSAITRDSLSKEVPGRTPPSDAEITTTTEDIRTPEVISKTAQNASVTLRRSTRIRKVTDKMKSDEAIKCLPPTLTSAPDVINSSSASKPISRKLSYTTMPSDSPVNQVVVDVKIERMEPSMNGATTISHRLPVSTVVIKQEKDFEQDICQAIKTGIVEGLVPTNVATIEDEICADIFTGDYDDIDFVEEVITLSDDDYCSSSDGDCGERCIAWEHRYSKNLCKHYHRQVAISDVAALEDHPVDRETRCSRHVPYQRALLDRRRAMSRHQSMKSVPYKRTERKRVWIGIMEVEVGTYLQPAKRKHRRRLPGASRRRRKRKVVVETRSDADDDNDDDDNDDDEYEPITGDLNVSSPRDQRNLVAEEHVKDTSPQITQRNLALNKLVKDMSPTEGQRNLPKGQDVSLPQGQMNLAASPESAKAHAGTSCKSPMTPRMRTLCLRLYNVHDLHSIWEIMRDFVRNERSVLLKFPVMELQRQQIMTLCKVCNLNFKVSKRQVVVVKHNSTPSLTVAHLQEAVQKFESEILPKPILITL